MTHYDRLDAALADGMAIAFHASQAPNRLALDSEFGARTFSELNARVNQLARVLRGSGLEPDDGVAMLMTNRPEFVEIYFACLRTGLRVTPINWHLTGDNAAYIVGNCEARVFIADVRCREAAADALAEHRDQLALALSVGGHIEGFGDYEDSLAPMSEKNLSDPTLGTQMLYTSGTTGRPKGVYRPRSLVPPGAPNRADTVTRAGLAAAWNPESDRTLCTGPAYHAAPLAFNIVAPLNNGVGTVLMDKWDALRTLELIESHQITHTHMVATMFHRLLALGESTLSRYDASSLRFLLHGAAPCPVHVKQSMINWLGPVLFEYYAATEGGGGFFVDSNEWLTKPGTVGRSPEGADNRILSDDGEPLPTGAVGTIYFKAPALRFNYFKDEEKTAKSYRGEFFTLGDMGYFDEDGYLFLTGRSAETIISGGVNIYPQETDDVLLKHEAVLDACTVGVPNDEWGEEVKSVVQLRAGFSATSDLAETLINFCREHLPAFKCPRTLDFAEDLPRLPSGKIQRGLVRAPFWAGRDRQI
ncbi:MAG: AMP-binding protein [Pseudomonadales bacterium]